MTQRRIYQKEFPYFVTFNTKNGLPLFEQMKYARLLSQIIFSAGKLKKFDVLSYQIMPEHVHLFTWQSHPDRIVNGRDRTLENVRSVGVNHGLHPESTLSRVRPVTRVRSGSYDISDLLQSIKGNFSREIHQGNIWQKRFYTRIINNQEYLENIIKYVKQNPIKQDLPEKFYKTPYQFIHWKKIELLF